MQHFHEWKKKKEKRKLILNENVIKVVDVIKWGQ